MKRGNWDRAVHTAVIEINKRIILKEREKWAWWCRPIPAAHRAEGGRRVATLWPAWAIK